MASMGNVDTYGVAEIPSAMEVEKLRDSYRLPKNRRREMTPHDAAFSAYLRGGMDSLSPDDRQLVSAGADLQATSALAAGGFRNVTSTGQARKADF
jgi:hypothetical protein